MLKALHSLGCIIQDGAAADRKALSSQASAPLKHSELRNPAFTRSKVARVKKLFEVSVDTDYRINWVPSNGFALYLRNKAISQNIKHYE